MTVVHMFGADANQLCLRNPDQIFSNKKAWDRIIGRIFPNGLMLRDGSDHRYHRRLMQAGFKSRAMQGYFQQMQPQIESAIGKWSETDSSTKAVYPAFKQMTLDLAATIFLGMDLGASANQVSKAFEATVAASMPRLPLAIPGTVLYRGIQARKFMCRFFLEQIPAKRASEDEDMFSLLCRAEDEEAAEEGQALWVKGDKSAAIQRVPDEMMLKTNLIGTADMIKERLAIYKSAGVTTLRLVTGGKTWSERSDALEESLDLVQSWNANSCSCFS